MDASTDRAKTFANILTISFIIASVSSASAVISPVEAQAQSSNQIAYLPQTSNPQNVSQDAVRSQAQACYQACQFSQALSLYHQICQSGAGTASDFYWLGEAYAHMDQYESAARSFSEALKLEPSNDKLHVRLVESLLAGRQRERAMEACRNALNLVSSERARQQLTIMAKICGKAEPAPQRGKSLGLNFGRRALTER